VFILALFAAAAASGAFAAAGMLGAAAALLTSRELQECAAGMAAALETIGPPVEES
jgi:hypothetical protein